MTGTEAAAGTLSAVDPDEVSEAIELLSDEVRLGIVLELAAAAATAPEGDSVGFADLRERVGVRDSGRFNYHLRRLCGGFVERTDGGYRLTEDGAAVADTLAARDGPLRS